MNNVYSFTSSVAGSVAEFVKNLPQNISHLVGRTITIIGNHPAHMQASPLAAGLTFVAANGAALVASHKIANAVEREFDKINVTGTLATIKSGVKFISVAGVVGGIAAGASTLVSLATAYPLTPVALGAIAVAAVVVRYGFKTIVNAPQKALVNEFKDALKITKGKIEEDQQKDAHNTAEQQKLRLQSDEENARQKALRNEQAIIKAQEDQTKFDAIAAQYEKNIQISPDDLNPQQSANLRALNLEMNKLPDLLTPKKPGEENTAILKGQQSPHKGPREIKKVALAEAMRDADNLKAQIKEAILIGASGLKKLETQLLNDNARLYKKLILDLIKD